MIRRFAIGGAVVVVAIGRIAASTAAPGDEQQARGGDDHEDAVSRAGLAVEPALQQMRRGDGVLGCLAAKALRERRREALVRRLDRAR